MHIGYSVISQKSMINIPDEVLEKLDALRGDCIRYCLENGKIFIQKVDNEG